MRIKTEQIELLHGPYDGQRVTVLQGTDRLVLAFDPFEPQPFTDKRRAVYRRDGGRLAFGGVVSMRTESGKAVKP